VPFVRMSLDVDDTHNDRTPARKRALGTTARLHQIVLPHRFTSIGSAEGPWGQAHLLQIARATCRRRGVLGTKIIGW